MVKLRKSKKVIKTRKVFRTLENPFRFSRANEMTLGAIMATIIFIILAIATTRAIVKVLPSNRAEESFDALVDKIKDAKEGIQATTIYLDKGMALMGFLVNSNSITIEYNKDKEADYDLIFNKPTQCTSGKTCVCLCTSFDKSSTGIFTNTYNCKSSICENFDMQIKFSTTLCAEDEEECINSIESEDFIVIRELEYTGIIDKVKTENPRISALYIEKEREWVGLCGQPPCLRWGGAGGSW